MIKLCWRDFTPSTLTQNMVQLNLLLKYVAADNEAANLLPKWV